MVNIFHYYVPIVFFVYLALPKIRLVKEPYGMTRVGQKTTLYCIASGPSLKSVWWRKESDGAQEVGDYSRTGVYICAFVKCAVRVMLLLSIIRLSRCEYHKKSNIL